VPETGLVAEQVSLPEELYGRQMYEESVGLAPDWV
jgi:hypothetical protein